MKGYLPPIRSLGASLPSVTRELFKKRGFAEMRLFTEWAVIVGPVLSSYSVPLRVAYGRDETMPAVLHVQVASAWATEVQHQEPLILDRIASYFGYRAFGRIMLHHHAGMMPPLPARTRRHKPRITTAEIDAALAACDDGELRSRLAALAEALFAKQD